MVRVLLIDIFRHVLVSSVCEYVTQQRNEIYKDLKIISVEGVPAYGQPFEKVEASLQDYPCTRTSLKFSIGSS